MITGIKKDNIITITEIIGDYPDFLIGMSIPTSGGNRHFQQLVNLINNNDANITDYVQSDDEKAIIIRQERDRLLLSCDWTQCNDSPLTSEIKTSWGVYRQALRDITSQSTFPESVIWPDIPSLK